MLMPLRKQNDYRIQRGNFRSSLRVIACCLFCLTLFCVIAQPPPPATQARRPASEADLKFWLENMIVFHGYTADEVAAATGMSGAEISAATQRLGLKRGSLPRRSATDPLLVLPYPGGRHPRLGFLEGAIDPQRETKVSLFTPWNRRDYVVVDVPEAIFSNLGLIYLAHTHVTTLWDLQGIRLPPLEWRRETNGVLVMERTLPNRITFGTRVRPRSDGVLFEQWLRNGTTNTLTDLHVQNCVMLKMAAGFDAQTNQHTVFQPPYAAIRARGKDRWIITAAAPFRRPWANPPVPCLHADPQFPDCPPGQTTHLRGWLSFYEGKDLAGEFRRLDALGWHHAASP